MRVVPGAPLDSLVWQSDIGQVRMIFRAHTDKETKRRFLKALRDSASEEYERWKD